MVVREVVVLHKSEGKFSSDKNTKAIKSRLCGYVPVTFIWDVLTWFGVFAG